MSHSLIVAAAFMWVPWQRHYGARGWVNIGYAWVWWAGAHYPDDYWGLPLRIDWGRIAAECGAVTALACFALLYALKTAPQMVLQENGVAPQGGTH